VLSDTEKRKRYDQFGENWRLLVHTQGYDCQQYLERLVGRLPGNTAERVRIARGLERDARLLAPELASALYSPPQGELPALVEDWRSAWGADWELGLRGFGLVVDPRFGHELAQGFARIEAQPENEREGLAEGLGRIALGLQYDEAKLRAAAAFPAPPALRAAFLHGGGWRLYLLHRLRPDRARAFLESLPADARPDFERGWREALERHTL
jgi:curved DNA-binding protein CbpA